MQGLKQQDLWSDSALERFMLCAYQLNAKHAHGVGAPLPYGVEQVEAQQEALWRRVCPQAQLLERLA
jgi:hypothetical protein